MSGRREAGERVPAQNKVTLKALSSLLKRREQGLEGAPFVLFANFERNGRETRVALTAGLRTRLGRLWGSRAFLKTLRNARYGLDPSRPRSKGGRDGLYLLDWGVENRMTRILSQHARSEETARLAHEFCVDPTSLRPVRLVSHDMRLLGFLVEAMDADFVILLDYDVSD